MNVPTLVADALGDEEVVAHLALKGDGALFVTRTRTLRYTSEGLLSDESVAEFPHDAERVLAENGRRKATITLDYGTRGEDSFTVPQSQLEEALHPVLAGVLNAAGVTEPGETVKRTFRFSELTLVITSKRLVKHIGSAVWDTEYEELPYEPVTGMDVEEGNVSSQLVLSTPDRIERIKAPTESFRMVEETVREALFEYYDVETAEEFEQLVGEPEEASADTKTAGTEVAFEGGVEPVSPGHTGENSPEQSTESSQSKEPAEQLEQNGFTSAAAKVEPSIDTDELAAHLDELESALETQAEAIETQQELIEAVRDLIPDQ